MARRLFTVAMEMDRDSAFAGRLEVVDTGRRRRWSVAEKVRIVEESYRGHLQVSRTARRSLAFSASMALVV